MTEAEFDSRFDQLTGRLPLSWQRRLFRDHFASGELPSVIDVPTGLGKTMVMAIWLIARETNRQLPRRLIYVVDRRTVVDQATDLAIELQSKLALHNGVPLAISTLRGQLADNHEWSRDPSHPAIIIGTVDLIGSALLFSGYRSGFKRRPLEAGLLGCDSLVVLDEAHLSKPFEKLLGAIGNYNRLPHKVCVPVKPTSVICMSATSDTSDDNQAVFRLDTDPQSSTCDLWSELDENGCEQNPVKLRFEAKKSLKIHTCEKKELTASLALHAINLARDHEHKGSRFVIFVRKPNDARAIGEAIRTHSTETIDRTGTKPKKLKVTPYNKSVEVLTGTMRGLERDKFVEMPVVKRFLDGDEDSSASVKQAPVFLVSTGAGEVGFDLNADHLVCDATTLDSLIQRLGRVNRRGKGDATVVLVRENEPSEKTGFDKACNATVELLTDGMSLSPEAIARWKARLSAEQLKAASSPEPATVELTDILLDAWSMTSITERMPGRPDVGPWLRGVDQEQAQTTVAWRAELELFRKDETPEKALKALFARHPIRSHESLTVNTHYLVDAFLKMIPKLKDRPSNLMTTRVTVLLARRHVVCKTLKEVVDNPGILYADSTLILPATFGGLDASCGMLDANSIPQMGKGGDVEMDSLDVADREGYEQTDSARPRLRIVIQKLDSDQWTAQPLSGGSPIPDDLMAQLEPSYEKTTPLFNVLKSKDLRVRLVQPIEFDAEGDPVRQLVVLAPAPQRKKPEDQALADHVAEVEQHAVRIADELRLDDSFREALLFAARWHDEGKKADVWQFFANGPMPNGELKGKTAQARSPQTLKHYRHEFGSLLRIHHPDHSDRIECKLPTARDLALHLIATHHGSGRPHFPDAIYDPFTDDERDAIHMDSMRRFAHLQRHYGWWTLAWLENLLRCADQLASAGEDSTEIDESQGVES